jgi:protein TonB
MTVRAVFSAYEETEQAGARQILFVCARRVANERYRLLLSLAMALLIHGFVFLLLFIFTHRQKKFDEPPRVLRLTLINATQAAPLVSAPKPEIKIKPLPLRSGHVRSQSLPLLMAEKSRYSSLSVAQTVLDSPKTVTAPVLASPVAANPAPVPPVPPEPLVSPRFDADYLSNPAMEYPEASRMRGEEGRVLLNVHVTEDGRPDAVTLYHSSGFPRLDRASVEAVWRWKFVPARQEGKAVAATVIVPVNFTLRR